jgi:hypothetical protein
MSTNRVIELKKRMWGNIPSIRDATKLTKPGILLLSLLCISAESSKIQIIAPDNNNNHNNGLCCFSLQCSKLTNIKAVQQVLSGIEVTVNQE